jgi:uncharacterized protein
MDLDNHKSFAKLREFLEGHRPPAIAHSGGTDSSFLAWAAHHILGNRMRAYTFDTPYMNHAEIREARHFCEQYGIPHEVIPLPLPEPLRNNPENRCYLCKLTLFSHLKNKAGHDGFCCVMDGSILDDLDEHRPGKKAIRELGILSPLAEAGFTKEEIRRVSRTIGLPSWDKPSNACLLTRIPYDNQVTEELLRRIEQAEELLREKGFNVVRVRTHGSLARIELGQDEMKRLLQEKLRREIVREMNGLGYTFVTLDIAGFRSGSYDK